MAHITIKHEGKKIALVDWATGDEEGDRANMFKAYRQFLSELKKMTVNYGCTEAFHLFEKWQVYELNIDDFPRINIAYPEEDENDR